MGLFDKLKEKALEQVQQLSGQDQKDSLNVQQSSLNERAPQNEEQYASHNAQAQDSIGQLYDPRLEQLINAALADGVLTEKEKQILFKKAEALGVDLDEFEMVLDAKLFEKEHGDTQKQFAAPTSNKLGDVRKCPACGAIIESFTTRCPDCGHELNGIGNVSSFNALISKLEAFDKNDNSIQIVSLFTGGESKRIQQKKQIISNFPIPTAREDLLEFLAMGVPLAQKKGSVFMRNNTGSEYYEHNQLASAWKSKLEQVLMKARLAMKDDHETLAEIEKYAASLK